MSIKKKRTIIVSVLAGIMLLLAAGTVYATVFKGEVKVRNHLITGSVAIDLTTWEEINGEQQRIQKSGEMITANQDISYIPKITSNRADCYVRLQMDVDMDKEIEEPITSDNVIKLGDEWIRKGDTFYYKKILKTGESIDAFSGIHVPEAWNNDTASDFRINLVADAVQADNFHPDFDADAPWGTVEIEQAKEKDHTDYRTVKSVTDIHTLNYKGNSIFEVSSKDFFSNFKYMMPGDAFKDQIKMKNQSKHHIKLLFKTSCMDDNVLLDKCSLRLLVDGDPIYQGDLKAKKFKEYQEIAFLAPDQTEALQYELVIPEYLKNQFSVEKDNVVWAFKAVETDQYGNPIQTGDDTNLWIFVVVAALALLAASAIMLHKRNKSKE